LFGLAAERQTLHLLQQASLANEGSNNTPQLSTPKVYAQQQCVQQMLDAHMLRISHGIAGLRVLDNC
jgi:hypothetical protein